MMKNTWLLLLIAVLLSLSLMLACGDDDDDDDDDNDDNDDDNAGNGGVCFWECEEDIIYSTGCLSGITTDEDCASVADGNCAGTVIQYMVDLNCDTCDDLSCYPDWYLDD